MTTSPTSFLSEILSGEPIPLGTMAYFQERTRNRLYEFVIKEFLASGLSKADVARRINKRPEQITRWLGAPGNWTFDTVSDLLLAISAAELEPAKSGLAGRAPRNFIGPEWIGAASSQALSKPRFQATITSAALPPTEMATGTNTQPVQWSFKR